MLPTTKESEVVSRVLAEYAVQFRRKPDFKDVVARYCTDNLSKGRGFKGWKIYLILNVPASFSPNTAIAEYYEQTDEVLFLMSV